MKQFDHEKLNIYHESINFVSWVAELLESVPKSMAVHGQLDPASTSVPLNMAEGNGKFTPKDRCKFFDNTRGSALECAACLDVLIAKNKSDSETSANGKASLLDIVSMLVGLILSNSTDRNA